MNKAMHKINKVYYIEKKIYNNKNLVSIVENQLIIILCKFVTET